MRNSNQEGFTGVYSPLYHQDETNLIIFQFVKLKLSAYDNYIKK